MMFQSLMRKKRGSVGQWGPRVRVGLLRRGGGLYWLGGGRSKKIEWAPNHLLLLCEGRGNHRSLCPHLQEKSPHLLRNEYPVGEERRTTNSQIMTVRNFNYLSLSTKRRNLICLNSELEEEAPAVVIKNPPRKKKPTGKG